MVTKLVLPMLGGSPSVWNTVRWSSSRPRCWPDTPMPTPCSGLKAVRSQLAVHLALLLLAGLFLPLKIKSGLLGGEAEPLGADRLAAGPPWPCPSARPFAVLSATAGAPAAGLVCPGPRRPCRRPEPLCPLRRLQSRQLPGPAVLSGRDRAPDVPCREAEGELERRLWRADRPDRQLRRAAAALAGNSRGR